MFARCLSIFFSCLFDLGRRGGGCIVYPHHFLDDLTYYIDILLFSHRLIMSTLVHDVLNLNFLQINHTSHKNKQFVFKI